MRFSDRAHSKSPSSKTVAGDHDEEQNPAASVGLGSDGINQDGRTGMVG